MLHERWLHELWDALPADPGTGCALMTTAGSARRDMAVGSDLDVLLIHPRKAQAEEIAAITDVLWYPLWDTGSKISPAVHSIESILELARSDLVTATTLLELRYQCGDAEVVATLTARALEQWRGNARHWLKKLDASVEARNTKSGEVAFLLEPDLKDGRGGLRDAQAMYWAQLTGHPAIEGAEEEPPGVLTDAANILIDARVELHRSTAKASNVLLLQEQDAVAAALGYGDSDDLMLAVSLAGRTIAWASDRFWARVIRRLDKRRAEGPGRAFTINGDFVLQDSMLVLRADVDVDDPTLVLRAAAAAAHHGAQLDRQSLQALVASDTSMPDPWPATALKALVSLLGAGEASVPIFEALDRHGLIIRVLPEWANVQAKPQRNAFHRFTVDRHLWQTAANAAAYVREVARPDLLLVGALLHDIGKGFPGDHTDVGSPIVRAIATRMGFAESDVDRIVRMEELHLLLPEVATRRDLADPRTITNVADSVGDVDQLELLRALTIADSLATGWSAWSDWKAGLVDDLVSRTRRALDGHRPARVSGFPTAEHRAMMSQVHGDHLAHVVGRVDGCTIAAPDRPGLFRVIAGALSLHSVDIVSADVWTSDDGVAVDDFVVGRRVGGETNWRRVEADLRLVLAGEMDLNAQLAEKVKNYANVHRKAQSAHPPKPEVLVDNGWSRTATVVEVRAPDGIGVLHRMAVVLERHGLDIRHAKVVTLGHEVVDIFYVNRMDDLEALTDLAGDLRAVL